MDGHPEDVEIIRVSPIQAARRQLDCAIELWFADGDAVSIHTLSAAAHQVIHDLHSKRCPGKELLFDASWIRSEKKKEFGDILREASNTFKHADRFPDKIVEITDFSSLMFMMVSYLGLHNLGEEISVPIYALTIWLAVHRPEYVEPDLARKVGEVAPGEKLVVLRRVKKRDFLEYFRDAFVSLPGGKWPG